LKPFNSSTKAVIKRDRLSDQIARNLEQMILSGELALGDTLPSERDLMERYDVGRPAIREALLWLNKKGLIAVSGGEKARVTEPNPKELLEHLSAAALMMVARPEGMHLFQQTRLFTEVALAREAAVNASAEDLKYLEVLLRANQETKGDVEAFVRTDDAFHFGIASISRNPLIIALYNSVLDVLQDQRHTSLQHAEALTAAIGCHVRIYEAIKARAPDAAEREMRKHLLDVETFYWAVREPKGATEPSEQTQKQGQAK
jgi:DNA-binding FadR family transcriptional regulator